MSPDTIAAIAACLLALFGILATNHHNRLSVIPLIVSNVNKDTSNEGLTISYCIANHGIGPARISGLSFFLNGKEFDWTKKKNPIKDLLHEHLADRFKYSVRSHSFPRTGYCITPGQTYKLAELFFPKDEELNIEELESTLDEIRLRLVYESFYRKKFVFDTDKERNRR